MVNEESEKLISWLPKKYIQSQEESESFWKSERNELDMKTDKCTTPNNDVGIMDEDGVHDPSQHHTIEHPTSNFATALHLFKMNFGTGFLAIPSAIKNGGLIFGTLGFLVFGIPSVHAIHLLLYCERELSRRSRKPIPDFAQLGKVSFQYGPPAFSQFSNIARILINTYQCLLCLGLCCVYYLFTAVSLRQVILEHFGVGPTLEIYLVILLLPLIFLSWIRNLKFLTPVMTVANLAMFLGLAVIFYYIFRDIKPIEGRKNFNVYYSSSLDDFPLCVGTAIFSFDVVLVVLPLKNHMKNPEDFGGWRGVFNCTMSIVILTFIVLGVFGYLEYGADIAGSITLNLPEGDWLASTVRIVVALSIFLSYPLVCYLPVSIIWPALRDFVPNRIQGVAEYAFRATLVLITFGLTAGVPDLVLGISLVGGIFTATLALIFPPMCSLCTNWALGYGTLHWKMWKDLSIISLGVIASLVSYLCQLV